MNKLACVAIVAVLVADGSAFAGALDQKQQTALNNLQAEVLRCSSFHLISQMGFEQSKVPGWEETCSTSKPERRYTQWLRSPNPRPNRSKQRRAAGTIGDDLRGCFR